VKAGRRRVLTASELRADVYRVLDEVIESGVPVEIDEPHAVIVGDPEELVHLEWSRVWRRSPHPK
jgi:hypothetical protein